MSLTREIERLRRSWEVVIEELDKIEQWHTCKGMKPGYPCSVLFGVNPFIARELRKMANEALGRSE